MTFRNIRFSRITVGAFLVLVFGIILVLEPRAREYACRNELEAIVRVFVESNPHSSPGEQQHFRCGDCQVATQKVLCKTQCHIPRLFSPYQSESGWEGFVDWVKSRYPHGEVYVSMSKGENFESVLLVNQQIVLIVTKELPCRLPPLKE